MRIKKAGLTLIELLIVLAIAGVLVGIGVTTINTGGTATQQAALVVSSAINQARFEAIRTNNTAGIVFTGNDGTEPGLIEVCRNVDETTTLACPADPDDTFLTIAFSTSDLARAQITNGAPLAVYFDRRGIVRNQGTAGGTITIADRNGGNGRSVIIRPTGRAEVQ